MEAEKVFIEMLFGRAIADYQARRELFGRTTGRRTQGHHRIKETLNEGNGIALRIADFEMGLG